MTTAALTILEPLAWMGERLTVPLIVVLVALVAYATFQEPCNQPAQEKNQ